LDQVSEWTQQLHEAMEDIRRVYGFGRGIAAPQLEVMRRIFVFQISSSLKKTIQIRNNNYFIIPSETQKSVSFRI
jgi:peptide deformylase